MRALKVAIFAAAIIVAVVALGVSIVATHRMIETQAAEIASLRGQLGDVTAEKTDMFARAVLAEAERNRLREQVKALIDARDRKPVVAARQPRQFQRMFDR